MWRQGLLVLVGLGSQPVLSFLEPQSFLRTRPSPGFLYSMRDCGLAEAGSCLEQAGESGFESLSTAGKALSKASKSFIVSWDDTADDFYSCADAFEKAASESKSSDPKLAASLELAAEEIRAASEVSGCLSAAPSAAAPNLLSFSMILADSAQHVSENDPALSQYFLRASQGVAQFVAGVEDST